MSIFRSAIFTFLGAIAASSALGASGQQTIVIKPKLAVSQTEFFDHLQARPTTLTSLLPKTSYDFYITVTIDENGHVLSVVPDYPCSQDHGCATMCSKLKEQIFKPFKASERISQAVATLHFVSGQKSQ